MVAVIKASKWKLSKVGFHCRLLKKRVWWIQELSMWGSRDVTPVLFSFVLCSSEFFLILLYAVWWLSFSCSFTLILKYNLPSNGKWYHYCSVTYRLLKSDFPLHFCLLVDVCFRNTKCWHSYRAYLLFKFTAVSSCLHLYITAFGLQRRFLNCAVVFQSTLFPFQA